MENNLQPTKKQAWVTPTLEKYPLNEALNGGINGFDATIGYSIS